MRTVRHGKNKGKLVGKLSDSALAKAQRIGANRRLAYLLAIWTGLRRSELKALRWSDVAFGVLPISIRLRAETTKSKRADSIALHPQIEQELRAVRPKDKDDDGLILQCVPSIRAFHADCQAAGIDLGSRITGFVDFHALRKTLSTMMATHGMSQRARQAHMRHTDPRLTEGTYMDERLLPIADELAKLPAIPPVDAPAVASLQMPSARRTG
jgi:integrase